MAQRFTGMGGHHSASAGTDEWLTPKWVLDALGPFDLDPCAPIVRPWPTAARHYTIEDDGLAQPWEGCIWLNPPYGRMTWRWLQKLADHGNGVALIFSRTETMGFARQVWERADAMLFLRGRLDFHRTDGSTLGNAGAPSTLVAYGATAVQRLRDGQLPGFLVEQWQVSGGHETLFGEAV